MLKIRHKDYLSNICMGSIQHCTNLHLFPWGFLFSSKEDAHLNEVMYRGNTFVEVGSFISAFKMFVSLLQNLHRKSRLIFHPVDSLLD